MGSLLRYLSVSVFCVGILWTSPAFSLCDAGGVPECGSVTKLDDLEQLLSDVSCVRASYKEKRSIANMSKPFESTGELLVVRGVGVILNQTAPFAKTTVLGHAGIVENGSRIVSMPDYVQQSLLSLFSLQFTQIRRDFSDTMSVEKAGYRVLLKPTSSVFSRNISDVVLAGSCYPSELVTDQTNGESRAYAFDSLKFSPFEVTPTERQLLQSASQ